LVSRVDGSLAVFAVVRVFAQAILRW